MDARARLAVQWLNDADIGQKAMTPPPHPLGHRLCGMGFQLTTKGHAGPRRACRWRGARAGRLSWPMRTNCCTIISPNYAGGWTFIHNVEKRLDRYVQHGQSQLCDVAIKYGMGITGAVRGSAADAGCSAWTARATDTNGTATGTCPHPGSRRRGNSRMGPAAARTRSTPGGPVVR